MKIHDFIHLVFDKGQVDCREPSVFLTDCWLEWYFPQLAEDKACWRAVRVITAKIVTLSWIYVGRKFEMTPASAGIII